jgi:Flp pilus assembly protein TadG
MYSRKQQRRAATVMEWAVVGPIFFLLLIGLIVGALGVFRYQQMASLAREGARFASVRGAKYAQVTGQPAATASDVYNQVILPGATALDPDQLGYDVTWSPDNRQGSQVTVKVTYHWIPEAFLGGVDLTSTSTMTVSY